MKNLFTKCVLVLSLFWISDTKAQDYRVVGMTTRDSSFDLVDSIFTHFSWNRHFEFEQGLLSDEPINSYSFVRSDFDTMYRVTQSNNQLYRDTVTNNFDMLNQNHGQFNKKQGDLNTRIRIQGHGGDTLYAYYETEDSSSATWTLDKIEKTVVIPNGKKVLTEIYDPDVNTWRLYASKETYRFPGYDSIMQQGRSAFSQGAWDTIEYTKTSYISPSTTRIVRENYQSESKQLYTYEKDPKGRILFYGSQVYFFNKLYSDDTLVSFKNSLGYYDSAVHTRIVEGQKQSELYYDYQLDQQGRAVFLDLTADTGLPIHRYFPKQCWIGDDQHGNIIRFDVQRGYDNFTRHYYYYYEQFNDNTSLKKENLNNDCVIYPNPNKGQLRFKGLDSNTKYGVKIYNLNGQLVVYQRNYRNNQTLNLPKIIKNGVYTAEIIDGDAKNYLRTKFILNR